MRQAAQASRWNVALALALGLLASVLERPRTIATPLAPAIAPAPAAAPRPMSVFRRVAGRFFGHRLMTEAAGVTFFGLLALFPALAAFVSLYGFIADPNRLGDQLAAMNGVVPAGGIAIVSDQLHALAGHGRSSLGLGLVVGLATSLWSANAAMKALFDAMNVVYDERERRSFVRLTLLTFCFTLGALGFLMLALLAVVALPVVLNFIGLGGVTDLLLRFGRWPVLMLLLTVALAIVYRYGPCRPHARWRWVSWGGALATVLWVVVSALFSWYVAHFGSYNRTYGSLGAVAGFMTWIWISTIVVLSGAEVDAELERQARPAPQALQ